MSDKVVLVPNGDAVYGVPVDVCEKYALMGDELASAQSALSGDSDVEGQWIKHNSRGEAYRMDLQGNWSRTPWHD